MTLGAYLMGSMRGLYNQNKVNWRASKTGSDIERF